MLVMRNSMSSEENLLREVVGDDKHDNKRKIDLNEEEEWVRLQRTGGGAET
tara:strand:+ start:130 stop:282 length:153 start_codon:yes stop_codon:yes gene_type:complete